MKFSKACRNKLFRDLQYIVSYYKTITRHLSVAEGNIWLEIAIEESNKGLFVNLAYVQPGVLVGPTSGWKAVHSLLESLYIQQCFK